MDSLTRQLGLLAADHTLNHANNNQGVVMQHNGAEIIIKLLERHGITTIAGIPGGANLPLYNALHGSSIRHILARHEQGAGFIAQGMARSTGKTAVCFATSGPGATNIITALADAKLDSIPIIVITGQVPLKLIGTDAFQEVDTYGMSVSITKHNFLVRSAEELLTVIPEAFCIASSGRPGPVLIDVPKDIQQQMHTFDAWPENGIAPNPLIPDLEQIDATIELIKAAKQPMLYVGGGIIYSGATEAFRAFAHKNSIPVTSTLMGLGCMEPDDPLYLGMLGMHGARYTNRLLRKCDLLLAFGVRFDDRATGKVAEFCPDAKIVHIDIDRSEFQKIKCAHITVNSDMGDALALLNDRLPKDKRTAWTEYVRAEKAKTPFPAETSSDFFHPLNIIRSVGAHTPADTIVTTDVGQHQMWVAQIYPFSVPRTQLTSGGLGTMGFGLPTAIGAALANPDKHVVCFTGDGSLLMNIQELVTLAELNLNVTIILLNNGHLGLVRQQQDLFYKKNFIATQFLSNPDFIAVANGFGMRGLDLGQESDPEAALAKALANEGPTLVNIPVHPDTHVLPMVPPGAANHEMIGE